MPRLLAILSLAVLATGCGPSFYERCLLGASQSGGLGSGEPSPRRLGEALREDFLGRYTPEAAHGMLDSLEAYCAELEARRRAR